MSLTTSRVKLKAEKPIDYCNLRRELQVSHGGGTKLKTKEAFVVRQDPKSQLNILNNIVTSSGVSYTQNGEKAKHDSDQTMAASSASHLHSTMSRKEYKDLASRGRKHSLLRDSPLSLQPVTMEPIKSQCTDQTSIIQPASARF